MLHLSILCNLVILSYLFTNRKKKKKKIASLILSLSSCLRVNKINLLLSNIAFINSVLLIKPHKIVGDFDYAYHKRLDFQTSVPKIVYENN